jgi:hypothetical protein
MKHNALFATVILLSSYLCGQSNSAVPRDKATSVTGAFVIRTDKTSEVRGFAVWGDAVHVGDTLVSCRGGCEANLGSVLLKADEVDFHTDTGEAEVRGNVRIRVLSEF